MSPSSDLPPRRAPLAAGGDDPSLPALVLPDRLDRDAARDLHAGIMARRGHALEIDGTAVRTAGTLALQVLVAAARDWAAEGQAFALRPSLPMRDDLARLGLLSEFRLREMT